ncbi:MAG: hypothetical protein KGL95_13775, partial [Patescibacteria group bacterium]|nr:hypothetical protein [Patescibacteria group bacterium]
ATVASGLVYLAKDATESVVTILEKNKVLSKDEGKQFAQDLKTKTKETQLLVKKNMFAPLRNLVKELGLVTKEDLEEILKNSKQASKRAKSA